MYFPKFFRSGFLALFLFACVSPQSNDSGKLNVVATTPILGDVVKIIGGDSINLTVLVPAGADPHAFEPVPQDAAHLAEADLIFVNGLGLESFMQALLDDATGHGGVIITSQGVPTLQFQGEEYSGADPHVWTNPLNVKIWADNIAKAFAELDPANAETYHTNAEAYKTQLDELDQWAMEQIAQIPVTQRVLVTDHEALGYFADQYGFKIVGALFPSYSTQSEPSARDLADLETAIRRHQVKAIFVGVSLNPSLVQRVAADTGIQLVSIYTETLSDSTGAAATYLDMIRYDVEAIVGALK